MSGNKFIIRGVCVSDLHLMQSHEIRMHTLNNTPSMYGHMFNSLGVLAATGVITYLFSEYVFPSISRLIRNEYYNAKQFQKEIERKN